MLSLFLSHAFSSIPLPLNDTYQNGVANPSFEYLVQGDNKAAILLILPTEKVPGIKVQSKIYGETEYKDMTFKNATRGESKTEKYTTITAYPKTDKPFYFKFTLTSTEPVSYTIRYVHTEPVYRVSAVLGTFALFMLSLIHI